MEFPYQKSGDNYYPVVKLAIIFGSEKAILEALIDSGANISIFGEEVAQLLGIEIEKGQKTYLSGVGGRIMGYIHKLRAETAGKSFSCKIVFSREYKVSFNLIGREDFFKKFVITFDEKNKKVILK